MITDRLLSHIKRQPIALLALFVALGGSSYAAVSSGAQSDEVIHACVGENSGRMRVVDSPKRCGSLETPLSFNREGREGDRGKTGERGRAGAKGDDGARGERGAAGLKGDAGANGAKGAAGPKGDVGAAGPAGATGAKGDTGDTGAAGANGQSVTGATESAGANCPSGGVRYTAANGAQYVCNGTPDSAADVLTKLKTVDGPGSGLDADTLEGLYAAELLRINQFPTYFSALFGGAFTSSFNSTFPNAFDTRLANLFGTDLSTASNGNGRANDCMMAEIHLTAANFPAPGTMFAAGQTLAISQWSTLFALLGTTYGGDGVTTFKVPDLRKQAPGGTHYAICHTGIFPSHP